ncbi:MAG: pirin family protein [Alphaproteobacteria bacterium]|jgi:redox-sensitive bicupin YhaK (pirin superfamily)
MSRAILDIITAQRTMEGAGFPVRRPFPTQQLDNLDPFLMLDEVGPVDWGPGEAVGAPDHPHRGFETISYILAGEKLHEDSTGDRQILGPGDVQWMTAGSGIVHSEMPSPAMRAAGGRAHSFQIWLNLPRQHKMAAQRYQFVAGDQIPLGQSADGLVSVRVIAGEAYGVQAEISTYTPVTLQDWTMLPGSHAQPAPPRDQQMALYLFQGHLAVGAEERRIDDGQLVIFAAGGAIDLALDGEADGPARFLLFGGVPIREPIARHGPFVMNTREELLQAFDDYHSGRMGVIRR